MKLWDWGKDKAGVFFSLNKPSPGFVKFVCVDGENAVGDGPNRGLIPGLADPQCQLQAFLPDIFSALAVEEKCVPIADCNFAFGNCFPNLQACQDAPWQPVPGWDADGAVNPVVGAPIPPPAASSTSGSSSSSSCKPIGCEIKNRWIYSWDEVAKKYVQVGLQTTVEGSGCPDLEIPDCEGGKYYARSWVKDGPFSSEDGAEGDCGGSGAGFGLCAQIRCEAPMVSTNVVSGSKVVDKRRAECVGECAPCYKSEVEYDEKKQPINVLSIYCHSECRTSSSTSSGGSGGGGSGGGGSGGESSSSTSDLQDVWWCVREDISSYSQPSELWTPDNTQGDPLGNGDSFKYLSPNFAYGFTLYGGNMGTVGSAVQVSNSVVLSDKQWYLEAVELDESDPGDGYVLDVAFPCEPGTGGPLVDGEELVPCVPGVSRRYRISAFRGSYTEDEARFVNVPPYPGAPFMPWYNSGWPGWRYGELADAFSQAAISQQSGVIVPGSPALYPNFRGGGSRTEDGNYCAYGGYTDPNVQDSETQYLSSYHEVVSGPYYVPIASGMVPSGCDGCSGSGGGASSGSSGVTSSSGSSGGGGGDGSSGGSSSSSVVVLVSSSSSSRVEGDGGGVVGSSVSSGDGGTGDGGTGDGGSGDGGGGDSTYVCVRSRSAEVGLPELSDIVPTYYQSGVNGNAIAASSGEMMNNTSYDSSYPVYQTMTAGGSSNWVMADYGVVGTFRKVRVGPPPCRIQGGFRVGAANGEFLPGNAGCDGSYYLGSTVQYSVDGSSWFTVGSTTSAPFLNSAATSVGTELVGDGSLKEARYIKVVGNGLYLGLSELHAVSVSSSGGLDPEYFCVTTSSFNPAVYDFVSGPYSGSAVCESFCGVASSSASSGDGGTGDGGTGVESSSSSSLVSSSVSSGDGGTSGGFSSSSSLVSSSVSSVFESSSSSSLVSSSVSSGDGGTGVESSSSSSLVSSSVSSVFDFSSSSSVVSSSVSSGDCSSGFGVSLVTVLDANPELEGYYYAEDAENGWIGATFESVEFRYEALGSDGLPISVNVWVGSEAVGTIVIPPGYAGRGFAVVFRGVVYCGVLDEAGVVL